MEFFAASLVITVILSACGEAQVALQLTTSRTAQNAYCNISTCFTPSEHTLCKYSNKTWGAGCLASYPTKSGVNAEEIGIILQTYNAYRRKVAKGLEARGNPGPQPSASNMRQLIWDEELAVMAQTHAQQCVFKSNMCRDVPRFRVGQNIFIQGAFDDELNSSDWPRAITTWYNEVFDMAPAFVTKIPSSAFLVVAHYTQVVWATTYTIGCGVAYYQSTSPYEETPYYRLYVCNYGPAGNFVNSPVYAQGAAGSACPPSTSNNDGLCA